MITTGGEKLWDWDQVVPWLLKHGPNRQTTVQLSYYFVESTLRVLSTADRVLRARDALRSEPDEQIRGELERLLEDA
jgi:hypothetical protein